MIIRSVEEIQQLIEAVKTASDELPAYNAFGNSTENEISDLYSIQKDLERGLQGHLPDDSGGEVYYWLTGKDNTLSSDFDVIF